MEFVNLPISTNSACQSHKQPLERYNRTLNQAFPTAHPTMDHFVTTINDEARRYVRLLNDIQRGYAVPPRHHPVPTPVIPPSYRTYRLPPAAMNLYGQN